MSCLLGLYRLLTGLTEPLIPGALRFRARGESPGLHAERLGRGAPVPPGIHWFHAASLGEVAALEPVLDLLVRGGGEEFSVTTMTASGRARAEGLWPGGVRLLPVDVPRTVRRVMAARAPRSLILVETEIWPNLWLEAQRQGVPVAMINARISDGSWPRYRRVRGAFRELLGGVRAAGARTETDAARLRELGVPAEAVRVTGNTKHDRIQRPVPARLPWSTADPPVWIAGSVHPGELEIVLEAHRRLGERLPGLKLILAPRHIDRLTFWSSRLEGFRVALRSRPEPADAQAEVLLLDTHGELPAFLAASQAAMIGGTWVPVGGHNPLEASAAGIPVVAGPVDRNIRDDMEALAASHGGARVASIEALVEVLGAWLADPGARDRARSGALRTTAGLRGGAARTLEWLVIRGVLSGWKPPGGDRR